MKMLLGIAGAVLACACGGGARRTTDPMPPPPATTACATMAGNIADVFIKAGEDEVIVANRPPFTELVAARCEADGWSAEAVTCLTNATVDDELQRCAKLLTPAQEQAIADHIDGEPNPAMKASEDDPSDEGGRGKPPPPPGGPAPDDPCGGGP